MELWFGGLRWDYEVNTRGPSEDAGVPRAQLLTHFERLVIVVVIVPVLAAPLVRIRVPPALIFVPAVLANFGELGAIFLGFFAVGAVMGDRFMEVMVGFIGLVLAIRRSLGWSEGNQPRGENDACRDLPDG
jgi:hypothetical protein